MNRILKVKAKMAMKGNFGLLFGVLIVPSLICGVATAIGIGIVGTVIIGALQVGVCSCYINTLRGKKVEFNNLFVSFKDFNAVAQALICNLLQGFFLFLWSLLLIVPGIIKSYSYAMSYNLLADKAGMDGNAAITESRRIMDGHKAELFLLDLSFLGWYLLSMLTFGLLFIYVIPYHTAARTAFYNQLVGKESSNTVLNEKEETYVF